MLYFAKALVVSIFIAFAAASNVITSVTSSTTLIPGQPFVITWAPDTSKTISLILRKGDASNLDTVGTIVSNIPNTGTYTWYPENTLAGGTDYAFEILGVDGTPNYSHYFGINNDAVKAASKSAATASVTATTLPENLVTDSVTNSISASSTLIVSGSSTFTSVSSMSSASVSYSRNASTSRSSASRSASLHSGATASASSTTVSKATALVSEMVVGTGLMTIIALSLASMLFWMM